MKALPIYFFIFLISLAACKKQELPNVITTDTYLPDSNNLKDTISIEVVGGKTYCISPHAAINFTCSVLGKPYPYWRWFDGDSSSKSKIISKEGKYKLLFGKNDTTVADSIMFLVEKCDQIPPIETITFYVPNVFTPNGDGKNDTWSPKGTGIAAIYYEVRNEDGILVFTSTSIKSPWDGIWKGTDKIGPSGTYLYYIEYTNIKGVFTKLTGALQMQR